MKCPQICSSIQPLTSRPGHRKDAMNYHCAEGPYGKGAYKKEEGEPNLRRLLYSEWARFGCWYKRQPLGLIRRYFGEKTGLYFAWLGFYTTMLIPAAFRFVYNDLRHQHHDVQHSQLIMVTFWLHRNKEICDPNGPPQGTSPCAPSAIVGAITGDLRTVACSVNLRPANNTEFHVANMLLRATMFMEFWKRKQATLAWEWNLADLDYGMEQIRPEYESTVKHYRLNPVTMNVLFAGHRTFSSILEQNLQNRSSKYGCSFCAKSSSGSRFRPHSVQNHPSDGVDGQRPSIWKPYAKITTSITASLVNLVVIVIMDKVYRELTAKLTNLGFLAIPEILFTLFGFRQDQCELGGCLFEVCVQLAIIMVGKQILNNISELSWAEIMNWWKRWWRTRDGPKDRVATTRWEIDYNLLECDRMALFDEYLEMVIQFGFVTLFVAAFPLAPLFALLNNIVEIRLTPTSTSPSSGDPCRASAQHRCLANDFKGIICICRH
ncbi:anoctamin-4 [Caerostris extrusa]|uniref:Anoctamin n=1 Tax=Caerostris extrusa TaxID=172846 RepID=A0AAV4M4D5_CAEEX|nr:anoctamin-4 [Caerostris extrusa]